MSRKGNCYDNACAETFFGTKKCEMLYHKRYESREEAHRDIFWYTEVFYNRKRRHQALDYMTPACFEMLTHKQLQLKHTVGGCQGRVKRVHRRRQPETLYSLPHPEPFKRAGDAIEWHRRLDNK